MVAHNSTRKLTLKEAKTLERVIEAYFVAEGEKSNALILKLSIIGRRGFNDRLCLARGGQIAFVELKRPGAKPRPLQRWIHAKLREFGFLALTIDTKDGVDDFYYAWPDTP